MRKLNPLCSLISTLAIICLCGVCQTDLSSAAIQTDNETEEKEEKSARRIYERYLSLLKRNPRTGTSLERVYAFHVDRGSLDSFVTELKESSAKDDADGANAMILGMVEARRGRDGAARSAFEQAEAKRPDDSVASWYLGQVHIAVGDTDESVKAFERALAKKASRADQEKIFQRLGRIYQRAQRTEEAIDLWKRFEAAFPDDDRVQEQIASILIEESQLEEALTRLEALSKKASDPYKKVQFAIKAADLKMRLGKQDEGLADYEEQLSQLKPSSWLFNDVRGRIEESFLRTDNYAGLVDYYEQWLKTQPDDLDAMSRLGQCLAVQGRSEAAQEWYAKAIAKAPSNPRLRLALIEQLIGEKQYSEAIDEYEKLAEIDPGNPDHIERWGMLYLRHEDMSQEDRQGHATEIWKRLLKDKQDDAIVVSRVADLFRSAGMEKQGISYYTKAVELEPENPQYREYLGEYFHILKRKDEAKKTWREMVAGDRRTTQNLVRLSEVFKGFGYADEALASMEEACDMDPEFPDLIRFNTMLRDAERFDDSLEQLARAEKMVATTEEQELILGERIKSFHDSGMLPKKTSDLEKKVLEEGTADDWRVLALYQEAMNRLPDAAKSAKRAVELAPESVTAGIVAARVTEKAGLLAEASIANSKLTNLDRRYRTEYLKKIAELERRLGRMDRALQAGKDLIAAAPGNPEHYQYYSDLCFQLGKPEQGLDALRRSVRVNPSDVGSLTSLARALSDQFKTAEAIELYWRAFQKAENLDDQVNVVQTLTELYLRTNKFDQLITRLENLSKELSLQRDMTICLANAHQAAGDVGMARDVLKELLSEESRDLLLLDELANLAEQANEYEEAVEYQKQIVALSQSADAEARLASLLLRSGDFEAAKALWGKISNGSPEPHRLIKSIDRLIESRNFDTARDLCSQLLKRDAEDWEALLRLAVIDWKDGDQSAAVKRCDQILALRIDPLSPSHTGKVHRSKRSSGTGTLVGRGVFPANYPPVYKRSQFVTTLSGALSLLPNSAYRQQIGAAWAATEFADARSAAIILKMAYATSKGESEEFLAALKKKAKRTIANDSMPAWDWYYANIFRQSGGIVDPNGLLELAQVLAQRPEPEAKFVYLLALNSRTSVNRQVIAQRVLSSSSPTVITPVTEPLNAEQIALLLDAWQVVTSTHPEWARYNGGIQMVITELERAKQDKKASELFDRLIRPNATAAEIASAMQLSVKRGDVDQMLELTGRLITLEQARPVSLGRTSTLATLGPTFAKQASHLAHEKDDWKSVNKLVVKFLDLKAQTFNPLAGAQGSTQVSPSFFLTTHHQVFQKGQATNYQQINTLAANKYLTSSDVTFLVNLHRLYAASRAEELDSILEDYRRDATGNAALFAELAMSHIRFLNGDQEQAAVHLVRAAEQAPEDFTLRLNLVRYYQKQGNSADALALLDTIEATDQGVMKEREMLALELASSTNNKSRAKKAAERLFGLRMTSKTALSLSSQMKKLGLTELSNALLARTRKTAGNDLATLHALMTKYKSEGNKEVANQIAHQILRRTRGMKVSRTNRTNPETMRKAAVSVLGASGQLDSLIERVEVQLERSPNSIRLHQTLAEYYKAAGKSKEASDIAKKLALLRPVTPQSALKLAQQFERTRKYPQACEKYLEVLKKDSSQYTRNYYQYLRTFQNGKQLPALADVLMEGGLEKLRNNHYVILELVHYLFRDADRRKDSSSRTKGLELFAAAWKAFPTQRNYLVSNIREQSVWNTPEMIEYAKIGMVPQTMQEAVARPWQGIADSISYSSNGTVTATLTRVCRALSDPAKLEDFTKEVQKGVERFEYWHGGKVILATLKAKAGDEKTTLDLLQQIDESESYQFLPTNVSWVVGGELEPLSKAYSRFVLSSLKKSLANDTYKSSNTFSYSPWRRLAILHHRAGESQEARIAVHTALERLDYSSIARSNPGYQNYMNLRNYNEAAEYFLTLGCPFDALELFGKVTPELLAASGRYATSSTSKRAVTQARAGETKARKAITPDAVLAYLERDEQQGKDQPPLDLMLTPPKSGVKSSGMESLVLSGLLSIDENDSEKAKRISDILARFATSSAKTNPSSAIAAVAFAEKTNDAELLETGFASLAEYLKATPAEDDGSIVDIALWLPAKSALKNTETLELGRKLATRAESAAEANPDDRWLIALMKEQGDMAIAAGDKPAAEKAWSKLLDTVLAENSSATGRVMSVPAASRPKSRRNTGSALEELRKRLLKSPAETTP